MHIICDHAYLHQSRMIINYLDISKIKWVALPPYRPGLNLIECYPEFFQKNHLMAGPINFLTFVNKDAGETWNRLKGIVINTILRLTNQFFFYSHASHYREQ